jgi:2,5-diketo-D-gluconate reductase A
MYGNEESVGKALRRFLESSGKQRSDIFITTKAGGDDVRKSLEESLEKLGLDYVDLYLSHSPLLTPARTQWPVMEALKKEGLARSVGVSNHRVSDLDVIEQVGTIPPSINQVRARACVD